MERVFLLLAGHYVCDFVLQGEAMGSGKSRRRNVRTQRGPEFPPWQAWLAAHALTHGAAVCLITGSWPCGVAETVLHAAIDHLKCERRISFALDQGLHLVCKGVWLGLLAWC
jgi:hypothetical protein